MEPIKQIQCPVHSQKNIQFVCLDIDCSQKIMCQDCVINDELDHDLQLLEVFLEQIDNGDLDVFYSNNLIAKQNKFNAQLKKIKKESINFYEFQIEQTMNKIQNQIIQELDTFKKQFLSALHEKIDSVFSPNCIQNCVFKNRLREEIQKYFKSGDFLDINSNLVKLHNGVLEMEFSKEKLQISYNKMNDEITRGLELSVKYFLSNLGECVQFLQDFSTLTKQSMKQELRQNSQSRDKKDILQARNSIVDVIDIQKSVKLHREQKKHKHQQSLQEINNEVIKNFTSPNKNNNISHNNNNNTNNNNSINNNFACQVTNNKNQQNNQSETDYKLQQQMINNYIKKSNQKDQKILISDLTLEDLKKYEKKQQQLVNIYSSKQSKTNQPNNFTNKNYFFSQNQNKQIKNSHKHNNSTFNTNNTNKMNNFKTELSPKLITSTEFKSKLTQKFLQTLTQNLIPTSSKQNLKKSENVNNLSQKLQQL